MYMLDTNAIIMTIRHPDWKIHDVVKSHLGQDLCISSITYGELEYGIRKSRDPGKNRLAIRQILAGIRILPFDAAAAEHFCDIFAELEKKRMRIGDRDMLIAGHARSLGCIVVTNNIREFSRVEKLIIEDWKNGVNLL